MTDHPFPDEVVFVPPHSAEAEMALIGSVLSDSRRIDDVVGIVRADDFYGTGRREIFRKVVQFWSDNKTVDAVTIAEALGNDENVSLGEIATIVSSSYAPSNAIAYAKVVAERSLERRLIVAGNDISLIARDEKLSSIQKLDECERLVMQVRPKQADSAIDAKSIAKNVIEEIQRIHDHKGEIYGLETGFVDLDRRFSGIRDGDLVVIAGRPSMGKTAFAMNLVEHNAIKREKPALVFSLEMTKEQLVERMASSQSGVELGKIRDASVLDSDEQGQFFVNAMRRISESPIFIDDTPGITINQLRAKARQVYRKTNQGLCGIWVDYLQLMNGDGDKREEQIAKISRGLKGIAKELSIPVIAISQLNRGLESRSDKRPLLSDLRESGAIEQDGDIIMFLYRDEVYNSASPESGVAQVITRKFRNGAIGTDYVTSRLECSRFDNSTYMPPPDAHYASRYKGKRSSNLYEDLE